MTTVVELRGEQLRRSKPTQPRVVENFRDDVVTYGGVLYDVLRRRKDFLQAGPPREMRRHRAECDETDT
jgi:hypothetical protein